MGDMRWPWVLIPRELVRYYLGLTGCFLVGVGSSGEGPERWHKGMYGYKIGSEVTRLCMGMEPGKHELVIPPFLAKLVQLWKFKCKAVIFSLPEDPVLHNLWLFSFFLKLNYSWFTMLYKFLLLLLFSCSVVSDSFWPHGLQHTRPPCSSPSPGACSNSCPLSQWCHPTIVLCHPLLSLPSIFPSIRVFSNESALGK